MNFSQEVVKEFQLSAANFDLSTGITSVGAINMVTRSGGNQFHGSGYFFFRDHNMSAYPGLRRNPLALDPFFARRNPGFSVSGPIKKDRLFFFFNYEYMNQTQAVTVQPDLPSVAGLAGNFPNPYRGKTSASASIIKSRSSTCCSPAIRTTAIVASVRPISTARRRCPRTGCATTTGPIKACWV